MSALTDRRRAAREAYHDELGRVMAPDDGLNLLDDALDEAIETASRVRVTPEIVAAYRDARAALNQEQLHGRPPARPDTITIAGLRAAFAAAGFEVEE